MNFRKRLGKISNKTSGNGMNMGVEKSQLGPNLVELHLCSYLHDLAPSVYFSLGCPRVLPIHLVFSQHLEALHIEAFYTGLCLPHSQIDGMQSGSVRMKGKQRAGASVTLKVDSSRAQCSSSEIGEAWMPSSHIWRPGSLQLPFFFFLLKMICRSYSSLCTSSRFGPKPLVSRFWAKSCETFSH